MNRSQMFPSKFLAASDIADSGKEGITVTILDVQEEKMRDGKPKPVIKFKEFEKWFVCNVTNWRAIEKMLGEESDDWIDEQIIVYASETTFDEEVVDCIRVKNKKPKQSKPGKKNSEELQKAMKLDPKQAPSREPGEDDGVEDEDIPY